MAGELKTRLAQIHEIPERMLIDYAAKTGASDLNVEIARNAELKIGAFHESRLVGFVCAGPIRKRGERILLVPAFYVAEDCVGKGVGKRLIYRVAAEAKKAGLRGVDMFNMLPAARELFEKEAGKWRGAGGKSPFKVFEIDWKGGISGKIRFRGKARRASGKAGPQRRKKSHGKPERKRRP